MSSSSNQDLINAIINNDVTALSNCGSGNLSGSNFSITLEQQRLIFPDSESLSIPMLNIRLLDVAAFYDSIECFIYLQHVRGLDINDTNGEGYLPLHYACFGGACETALYILSIAKRQATTKPQPEQQSLLYCAVVGRNAVILDELFSCGARFSDLRSSQQKLLVEKAIGMNNKPVLDRLFDAMTNELDMIDLQNKILEPCKECIITYNLDALKTLYNGKIDIMPSSDGSENLLSLVSLICHNDVDKYFKEFLIQILNEVKGFKIDPIERENIFDEGVCHWACRYKDLEIAQMLLDTPKYNINRFDRAYKTGAAYLADDNTIESLEILKLLISKGLDVNAFHEGEPTLLQYFVSAVFPNYNAIKILLDNNANPNAIHTKCNCTITEFVRNKVRDQKVKSLFDGY
ncbi:hypothetical protein M9Y10_044554 [Tritrichomonas musculus]|uniref:Ankyrin repeat protein n=1 Tax=Tritrichomonas musculus TaxID=1915356 RepID=A0ABR2JTY5_9EUKA